MKWTTAPLIQKGATDRLSYEPLAFLPANTKSVIQPCDMGKIRNLSSVIHNESGESISFACPSALQQKSLNIYKRFLSTSCDQTMSLSPRYFHKNRKCFI